MDELALFHENVCDWSMWCVVFQWWKPQGVLSAVSTTIEIQCTHSYCVPSPIRASGIGDVQLCSPGVHSEPPTGTVGCSLCSIVKPGQLCNVHCAILSGDVHTQSDRLTRSEELCMWLVSVDKPCSGKRNVGTSNMLHANTCLYQ